MAIPLKQSTASQEIPLGPFLDKTDGVSQETALTIANTDIKVWKAGATTLANKNSGGATHISAGVYYAVLDATDTDTAGPLVIFCHITADALPVKVECVVHPANVYDSLYGTDKLDVNVAEFGGAAGTFASGRPEVNTSHFGGTAGTFASGRPEVNTTHAAGTAWGSGAITAASIATGAIDADALAADAANEIADALLARDIGSGTGAGSLDERTVRSALRLLRNKTAVSANTLTVYKENDSDSAWSAAVTSDAGANPITAIDPTGP